MNTNQSALDVEDDPIAAHYNLTIVSSRLRQFSDSPSPLWKDGKTFDRLDQSVAEAGGCLGFVSTNVVQDGPNVGLSRLGDDDLIDHNRVGGLELRHARVCAVLL